MRIVLANSAFHTVGGSETYLLTLAEQILRLGHDVRIFANTAGDMAELARRQGIPVVTDPADLGEPADAVVTQDGAVAYELAAVWPQVPQVFVCHSSLFDFQQPPLVPGVASAVVVLNDRVRQRIEALDADLRIVRLRQPIDTQRFQPRSAPRSRPRRALILSNYLAAEGLRVLVETWQEAGVEVVQIGTGAQMSLSPEEGIDEADIVVGKGRVALEAMACGRPTYLYDMFGGDGWITPENYAAIEADGITGNQLERGTGVAQLRADLEEYDPELGRLGRELINRHHDARHHTHAILDLLHELAPTGRTQGPTLEAELGRQVRLRWAADGELFSLRTGVQQISAQARDCTDAYEAQLTHVANLEALVQQLNQDLAASQQDTAILRQIRTELETKVDELRERVKTNRQRLRQLRARLRAVEEEQSRPWWKRSRSLDENVPDEKAQG